jgi:hypothetical protein
VILITLPPPSTGTQDEQKQSEASKIKNVSYYDKTKLLKIYSTTQHLSADESTVNFKGCVVFKMYNLQKPTK